MRSRIITAVAVIGLGRVRARGLRSGTSQQPRRRDPAAAGGQPASTADMSPEGNQKFLDDNKAKAGRHHDGLGPAVSRHQGRRRRFADRRTTS